MPETHSNLSPETPRENEIADYYDGINKLEIQSYEGGIKKARNAQFVTAGLLLLGEILAVSMSGLK